MVAFKLSVDVDPVAVGVELQAGTDYPAVLRDIEIFDPAVKIVDEGGVGGPAVQRQGVIVESLHLAAQTSAFPEHKRVVAVTEIDGSIPEVDRKNKPVVSRREEEYAAFRQVILIREQVEIGRFHRAVENSAGHEQSTERKPVHVDAEFRFLCQGEIGFGAVEIDGTVAFQVAAENQFVCTVP